MTATDLMHESLAALRTSGNGRLAYATNCPLHGSGVLKLLPLPRDLLNDDHIAGKCWLRRNSTVRIWGTAWFVTTLRVRCECRPRFDPDPWLFRCAARMPQSASPAQGEAVLEVAQPKGGSLCVQQFDTREGKAKHAESSRAIESSGRQSKSSKPAGRQASSPLCAEANRGHSRYRFLGTRTDWMCLRSCVEYCSHVGGRHEPIGDQLKTAHGAGFRDSKRQYDTRVHRPSAKCICSKDDRDGKRRRHQPNLNQH